jgi:hypothetical protein
VANGDHEDQLRSLRAKGIPSACLAGDLKQGRHEETSTMSERASNNSVLYFLVGGLVVAVLAVGYIGMGRGSDERGSAGVAASATVEDSVTDFKLELGKDGGVSGSIEKK